MKKLGVFPGLGSMVEHSVDSCRELGYVRYNTGNSLAYNIWHLNVIRYPFEQPDLAKRLMRVKTYNGFVTAHKKQRSEGSFYTGHQSVLFGDKQMTMKGVEKILSNTTGSRFPREFAE